MKNSYLYYFCDNNAAVEIAISKGSAKGVAEDINTIICRTWVAAFQHKTALYIELVESEANCADEPTRETWICVRALGAMEISPRWPGWIDDLWGRPKPTTWNE